MSTPEAIVAEQAALRRMATLVAGGAGQSAVFEAIVTETADLFGEETWLLRFGAGATRTLVARHGSLGGDELVGVTVTGEPAWAADLDSGRPIRIDDYAGVTGSGAELARRLGVAASVVAPLVVQGGAWGALMMISEVGLPGGIEDRLQQFAELAATAVANAASRAELQLLADEQAALRRVAELVARGAPTEEVFDRVTVEAGRLLDDAPTILARFERSGTEVVIVAQWLADLGAAEEGYALGTRQPVAGELAQGRVWRTGRAARIDDYAGVEGVEMIRPRLRASVSAPIVVEGRLWGFLRTGSLTGPMPAGTEERLTSFCELVAAAIANADSRAQLTASRARIVASGDEARRRLARDVHDGAQQRLVHAIIALTQARAAVPADGAAAELLDESLHHARAANEQLRELAHGIMPAALTRGGLRAAVDSLRAHVPLSMTADVTVDRLPERVEVTAYFVISEALTNVVKHAGAGHARVRATVDDRRLSVEVSDDGRGGAAPAAGSGLVGLADRVDAAGGSLSLTSPAGGGTTLVVMLPIDAAAELAPAQV